MALVEYQKKRDFRKSPEPLGSARGRLAGAAPPCSASGGTKAGRRKKPIFVVQKHTASHLHYDFRLEHRGVLKSWAVPKGPPRKAGEKKLAVEVEDHPLAYARFHGRIPEGEYGAGTVEIWDSGTYVPLGSLESGLSGGHITVALSGRKLKGEYALVRFRGLKEPRCPKRSGLRPERRNWLILKAKKKP